MKKLTALDPAVATELAVIADRRGGPDGTAAADRSTRRWRRAPREPRARRP